MGHFRVLIALAFIPLYCFSSEKKWDVRGHYRALGSAFYSNASEDNQSPFISQALFNSRLVVIKNWNNWSLEAAYEFFLVHNFSRLGVQGDNTQGTVFNYRIDDIGTYLFNHQLDDSHEIFWLQNFDRLYTTYQTPSLKLVMGRQVVSFGSARTINPLDVLVPFDFLMINLEQRTGVDAIRLVLPTGDMSEFEVGLVLDQNLKDSEQFRFISYGDVFKDWDYKLYLMSLYQHLIKGVDLQGSIANWGVWLEYGNFKLFESQGLKAQEFERYSLGAQYLFSNELSFFGEFHYNGAGESVSNFYQQNLSKTFQKQLAIFLSAKHYFNLGFNYRLNPLHILNLTIINNLNDGSRLISPSLEYNMAQDWYFSLGGFISISASSVSTSEFAQYPSAIYMSIKKFF
jgi:hypothetical protein